MKTTLYGLLSCLLIAVAAAAQAETELAWQAKVASLASLKEPGEALERIKSLEVELAKKPDAQSRRRLGELIVRAKLPRLSGLAQGAAASKAIALFEQVLSAEPDDVDALYLHGRTCAAMPKFFGKQEAAKASLERLVKIERRKPGSVRHADAFAMLARILQAELDAVVETGRRAFPDDPALKALGNRRRGGKQPAGKQKADRRQANRRQANRSKKAFKDALLQGQYDFATLDRGLADGQELHADDHQYPLFRGLLRLWALEGAKNANPRMANEAAELFEQALTRNPADTRIYGWLGPLLYASGYASGNAAMKAKGEAMLDRGVLLNPEQNLFSRALAYRITGDHPDRVQADLYKTLDVSCGKPVDRNRFRGTGVTNDHPACRDSENAPHNLAGTFYWAGEFFRERRDAVRARDAFSEALRLDPKGSWPYRKLAVERLAWLDDSGKPLTANPVSCLLCHQR